MTPSPARRPLPPSQEWKKIVRKFRKPLQDPFEVYCPICLKMRRLEYRPKLRLRRLGVIFALTCLYTGIFWPALEWRGLWLFVPIFLYSEGSEWLKVREDFRCPVCGFDPRLPLSPELREKYMRRRGKVEPPAEE